MIVADSSPLIHLASVEHFGLFHALYQRVFIPPAVFREVVEQGDDRAGQAEVQKAVDAGWMEIRAPSNTPLIRLLQNRLDDGESEAIVLAQEIDVVRVILDETQARQQAESLDLPVTGTLGILIRACTNGDLDRLQPVLDRLRHQGSFWISDDLYRKALRAVNEAE